MNNNTIKLGIGFATGRKSFKKVLSSYIYSWNESGFGTSYRRISASACLSPMMSGTLTRSPRITPI
jgi:hypothetical protein